MKTYTFELLRTYSTLFEIEAETQQEANDKFKALGNKIYTEEMEQCEVIKEEVKGDKYARKCTCCAKGMNSGYFAEYEYFCSTDCLFTEYTYDVWQKLSNDNNDSYYWTEWDDEFDYQYQIINGELQEIDNF